MEIGKNLIAFSFISVLKNKIAYFILEYTQLGITILKNDSQKYKYSQKSIFPHICYSKKISITPRLKCRKQKKFQT